MPFHLRVCTYLVLLPHALLGISANQFVRVDSNLLGHNSSISGLNFLTYATLPTAEILSVKKARAWVSMVLYLKKIHEN